MVETPPPPTTTSTSTPTTTTTTAAATTTARVSPPPPVSPVIKEPRQYDILCGKDKACISHYGSRHFRGVIEAHRSRYEQVTTKQEKMSITKEIVCSLNRSSSRFLKYNAELQGWEEISHMVARDKVSHALRFANLRSRKRQEAKSNKKKKKMTNPKGKRNNATRKTTRASKSPLSPTSTPSMPSAPSTPSTIPETPSPPKQSAAVVSSAIAIKQKPPTTPATPSPPKSASVVSSEIAIKPKVVLSPVDAKSSTTSTTETTSNPPALDDKKNSSPALESKYVESKIDKKNNNSIVQSLHDTIQTPTKTRHVRKISDDDKSFTSITSKLFVPPQPVLSNSRIITAAPVAIVESKDCHDAPSVETTRSAPSIPENTVIAIVHDDDNGHVNNVTVALVENDDEQDYCKQPQHYEHAPMQQISCSSAHKTIVADQVATNKSSSDSCCSVSCISDTSDSSRSGEDECDTPLRVERDKDNSYIGFKEGDSSDLSGIMNEPLMEWDLATDSIFIL